jgi:NTP pyrophosphatase (non-canonical NTP hydrolase)
MNRQLIDEAATLRLSFATTMVTEWVRVAFGPVLEDPLGRRERGLRLAEEAIELAQALGVSGQEVAALTQRVYEKPADESGKELAQVFIILLSVAGALDYDLSSLVNTEWDRIQTLGPAHFTERMRRKIELGLAAERVPRDGQASRPLPGAHVCERCRGSGNQNSGTCQFCHGTGYRFDHEASDPDEALWLEAVKNAQLLTAAVADLRGRGYEVTLAVGAAGAWVPKSRELYGDNPEPAGFINTVIDPQTIRLSSARRATVKEFKND